MIRNFVLLSLLSGISLGIPAAQALPSTVLLHQSMLFPTLESGFTQWCRIAGSSRTEACFVKSFMAASSRIWSAPALEKLLQRELFGVSRLNRGGLRNSPLQGAFAALFKKHPAKSGSSEALSTAEQQVMKAADRGHSSWIDGVLYSALENGDLIAIQKSDPAHGVTEILVIYAGSQVESF